MGVRASQLCAPRTFSTIYDDHAIEITYTRQRDSVEFIKGLDEMEGVDSFVALVANLVISWDLLDDTDQPYPTTDEALRKLPFHFIRHIGTAISEDVIGGKDSSNGSAPSTTSTEAVPTGTPATADAGT